MGTSAGSMGASAGSTGAFVGSMEVSAGSMEVLVGSKEILAGSTGILAGHTSSGVLKVLGKKRRTFSKRKWAACFHSPFSNPQVHPSSERKLRPA